MYEDRGLQFEKNWKNGIKLEKGESTKGSTRLDVRSTETCNVYDFKYVRNPGKSLKPQQIKKILENVEKADKVIEINPKKLNF